MPSAYTERHMVLETDHFSEYVIVYEGDEELADVTEETDTEGTDATENVTEEVQEEKGGSPIIPIILVIIVIAIAGAAYVTTKKMINN